MEGDPDGRHRRRVLVILGVGAGEVVDHPLQPQFAENATDEAVLRLTESGHEISYTLKDAASAGLSRNAGPFGDKDQVEYSEVFPATDLVYDVEKGGVKQYFRLDRAPEDDERTSWTWQIDTDGLELVKTETGLIEFREPDGEVVLVVPPLQAWDSAGESKTQANVSTGLETVVDGSGSQWTLTVKAKRSWLTADERKYPVWIDPLWSLRIQGDVTHGYKSNGQYNYNQGMQIGNTNNNGIWRTVAHYPYEQFFGKQILDANVGFWDISGDSTTTNQPGTLYWANAFSYNGVGHVLGAINTDNLGGWVDDDRLTGEHPGRDRHRRARPDNRNKVRQPLAGPSDRVDHRPRRARAEHKNGLRSRRDRLPAPHQPVPPRRGQHKTGSEHALVVLRRP